MTLNNFDYKVDRNKDTVLIDTEHWVLNNSNVIQKYRMSGRSVITYLARVQDKYITDKFKYADTVIKKGTTVLISRIASEIARDRGYNLDGDKYYNVPVTQIMGYFEDNIISFDTLNLLYDKILIEKIVLPTSNIIQQDNNSIVGKVLKTGKNKFSPEWKEQPLTVKTGDNVLVKDNATTTIILNNKEYLIMEENAVVGIFSNDKLTSSDVRIINNCVLLKEYMDEKLLGSEALCTPFLNYEDLDETDVYNRNLFQVVQVDDSIHGLNKGDIILADRSLTNYVYMDNNKYFMLSGTTYISTKIR